MQLLNSKCQRHIRNSLVLSVFMERCTQVYLTIITLFTLNCIEFLQLQNLRFLTLRVY